MPKNEKDKWIDDTSKESFLKRWENNPNKEYIVDEEGNLASREIAEKYVVKRKLERGEVVHHIDGDTFNNSIKNLYVCKRENHRRIHNEQIRRKKKFNSSEEIDFFLKNFREKGQKILKDKELPKIWISTPERREFPIYSKRRNRIQNISDLEKKSPKKLKEKLIKEIRETEGKKEVEKRYKEKEELVKKAREFRKSFEKEKKQLEEKKMRKKLGMFFVISILILISGYYLLNNSSNISEQTNILPTENITSFPEPPKVEPLIVESSNTEVIITNNQENSILLNVTYRIYSKWFGIDSTESQVFNVEAKEKKSFQVYFNNGCSHAPCSVIIVNYESIK